MFKILLTPTSGKQLSDLKNDKSKQAQYKTVVKVIAFMSQNIRHPSLNTHKFSGFESPFGNDVFESYAQNHTPGAYRIFWAYGPNNKEITILLIIPHP